jgi:hypothetical protein
MLLIDTQSLFDYLNALPPAKHAMDARDRRKLAAGS